MIYLSLTVEEAALIQRALRELNIKTEDPDKDQPAIDISMKQHLAERLSQSLASSETDFVPPEVSTHLLALTNETIEEMDRIFAANDPNDEEGYRWADPNDYFIWHDCVKPVLETAQSTGFHFYTEMDDKGYGFLMHNVPVYLMRHTEIPPDIRGWLVKLCASYLMQEVLDFTLFLPADSVLHNTAFMKNTLRRVIEILDHSELKRPSGE